VNLSIRELESRLKVAQDKFELLRLREDIATLMEGLQFKQLSQNEQNRVEDLLVEVLAKEEQYKGCDPLRNILGY
jgi:hypothetical protein